MQSCEKQQEQSLTFKIQNDNEIRRFSVPFTSEWEEIISKICMIFNLEKGSFAVKYEDDEKELITIDSTIELQEAVKIFLQQQSVSPIACIRLQLFKTSSSPASPIVRSVSAFMPTEHRHPKAGLHEFHGFSRGKCGRGQRWQGHPNSQFYPHHHRHHWSMHSSISENELAEKLKELEDMGFKCKVRNIRLLKMNGGDVTKVAEILTQKQKKRGDYLENLKLLEEKGFDKEGLNLKLLRRFGGNTDKVIDILSKSRILEEKGFSHLWMNIRLLIKFDGDLEKVESVWGKKQERLLRKADNKRVKALTKEEEKSNKAEKKEWKKSCNKSWKQRGNF